MIIRKAQGKNLCYRQCFQPGHIRRSFHEAQPPPEPGVEVMVPALAPLLAAAAGGTFRLAYRGATELTRK